MRHLLLCGSLLFAIACGGGGSSTPDGAASPVATPIPSASPTPTASPTSTPDPSPYIGIQPGDRLWSLNLSANPVPTGAPSGITWEHPGTSGGNDLQIVGDASGMTSYTTSLPLDLTPYRGAQISLDCTVKAEGVTQPTYAFDGIKVMLTFESASEGKASLNTNNLFGTFGWTNYSCTINVAADATNGKLVLGLRDCKGKVWISDVHLTMLRPASVRPTIDPNAPPIARGHVPLRGVLFADVLRPKDFPDLGTWKVNLIRWIMDNYPIDMTTVSMADFDLWVDAELAKLDQTLLLAKANGQKVVVAMFDSPGGREADGTLRMLYDATFAEHFVSAWKKIAAHCKGNPAIFAYDPINEPVQSRLVPTGMPDWLGLQLKAARAIRAVDPDTPITIAVDQFDGAPSYRWMSTVDIPHVIYQVHMYYPHSYTHQGVYNPWGPGGDPVVAYPGTMDGTATGKPLNKDVLRAHLQPVRDFQLAYRVPILMGEFSAARWAPGASQYLSDLIDIFEEYGWDWIYCAFRVANCWNVELNDLPYEVKGGVPATTPTGRMLVLRHWFDQNQSPY